MRIEIPELSLVVLMGPSGSGKTTFARRHFRATEILSSDACRGMVADDENDQRATGDAFAVLHFIAGRRLAGRRLTVVDATSVQEEARRPLVALAREHHVVPVAIVLDLPEQTCLERNRERPDREFGRHVIRRQRQDLRRSLNRLQREGFRYVFVLSSEAAVDAAVVARTPLWTDIREERGPFDIIGDLHGCYEELTGLLERLGYSVEERSDADGGVVASIRPPDGRKAVFLGDLVDRGPAIVPVLDLVMGMVEAGSGLCVPGNHDVKLLRALQGRPVQVTHGLADSLAQLEAVPGEFRERLVRFLDSLVSHYVLDGGDLVVAHAGMREDLQGRASRRVRDFALYGETTGETDEFGLPVRHNWAADYRGSAMVVYGHTPVPEPEWLNRTINIDTGCVFGGRLTALRYPEMELVSVPAARVYARPARPIAPEVERVLTAQQAEDALLDLEDITGKRFIETRLHRGITIREENAAAALEAMTRFAVNPKWLVYLPPTMSPSETSSEPGLLEHPSEAFAYYHREGVDRVICQEKHMGSRAVVIVCRDESAARRRFGVVGEGAGICYTRTGRRFFDAVDLEAGLLEAVRAAADHARLWEELGTDWLCLDCELMPWSAKAGTLISRQYAPVGAAARAAFAAASAALAAAAERGLAVESLQEALGVRENLAARYRSAYLRYCWEVRSTSDLRLAPFQILASESGPHLDRDHLWHMEMAARLGAASAGVLTVTRSRLVDLGDAESRAAAAGWWSEMTEAGGEGMVVKPVEGMVRGRRGLVQPALKCRGREYLRIIYGPEYTLPPNLERLRQRAVGAKRSLALREFSLGVEALERFARREPLRRVHECVFGILALESEPVDPRL